MDYYKTIVGKMGIDPEYFWHKMTQSEVNALFEAIAEEYEESWEKIRTISYYAASGMSKLPSMRKFMPFPWDNKTTETTIEPSEDRMNQLIKAIDGN